jgi:CHAD domain-containing protein
MCRQPSRSAPPSATGAVGDASPGVRLRLALDLSIPRLLAEAGYRVDTTAVTRRRTHLYDTGDGRLAAANAELSLNTREGWRWRRDPVGHPRLPAREWSVPAASTAAEQVALWSRAYRRGRPLTPRATVTVHRRTHHVGKGDADRLLTIDEERHDIQSGGRWMPRLRRVMVHAESAAGIAEPALVVIRGAAIPDAAALSVLRPTLLRAPRLRLPGPGSVSARDLFVRSATLSVIQWLYYDCEVSGGGAPDAVRKLRVALRRLRSDLQTFAPLLDRDWAEGLREQLGTLASGIGVVRDAEVLCGRLGDLIALLPDGDHEGALALLDVAGEQLAAARAELLGTLAGDPYLAALDGAMVAATAPRFAEDADGAAPVTLLARRPWRRLRAFVSSVGPTPADTELHRIRILAKRARYAADACVPAVGARAARSAARLAELQTVLGDEHDAVVTREWLRRRAEGSATVAFAAGELAALELGRLTAARERWRTAWADASRTKDWRWLRS